MNASMTMGRRADNVVNAELAEVAGRAGKILLCGFRGFCVLCVLYSGPAAAAPPVRTMYTRALAQEETLRAALAAPDAAPSVLDDTRAVVAAYEAIVRHYPASGYSDNALWQAGRLALDAFARFGQPADRDTGVRLLRRLAAGYPTSKFVAQVPEILKTVNRAAGDLARPKGRALQETEGVAAHPNTYVGSGLQAGPIVGPA